MINVNERYMMQALELAKLGWGKTSPNPMVGCVIVLNGEIVGKGYHHKAGEAHAEVNAISDAGEFTNGAAAYVTLEPCSTTGRTGPCTQALIDAGISKVFIGSLDPNPEHAGRGVKILQNAGIEVNHGIIEQECLKHNEAFFKWIQYKTPFVLLKMAMTLDGKIATKDGQSQWITSSVARSRVQKLRQWSDAIMVGGETVRKDHPSLTVREIENWPCQPERIVISRSLTNEDALKLMPCGVKPSVYSPSSKTDWKQLMKTLGGENITSLLIEGGGELAASALEAGVVDKVEFHIAPKILGGKDSRSVIGGVNPSNLSESLMLEDVETFSLGCDIAISGYIKTTESNTN